MVGLAYSGGTIMQECGGFVDDAGAGEDIEWF